MLDKVIKDAFSTMWPSLRVEGPPHNSDQVRSMGTAGDRGADRSSD